MTVILLLVACSRADADDPSAASSPARAVYAVDPAFTVADGTITDTLCYLGEYGVTDDYSACCLDGFVPAGLNADGDVVCVERPR